MPRSRDRAAKTRAEGAGKRAGRAGRAKGRKRALHRADGLHDRLGNRGVGRALRARRAEGPKTGPPAAPSAAARDPSSPGSRAGLGSGQPLPASLGAVMESRFGSSFADVRVHTGRRAASAAAAVSAKAFTSGSDIVFGRGRYAPDTPEGRRLLAHELTHVVQQRNPGGGAAPEARTEAEADRAAREVAGGGFARVREGAAWGTVQRQAEETSWRLLPAWPEDSGLQYLVVDGTRVGTVEGVDGSQPEVEEVSAWERQPDGTHLRVVAYVDAPAEPTKYETPRRWTTKDIILETPIVPQPIPPSPTPTPKRPTVPARPQTPTPTPQPPDLRTPEPREDRSLPKEPAPTPQPSSLARLRVALDEDPSRAIVLAGQLTDHEMGELDLTDRLRLLQALALPFASSDVESITRVLNTTPERDAGPVADALDADNGKRMAELRLNVPADDPNSMQLELAAWGLESRRLDKPASKESPPWADSLLRPGLHDPGKIHWGGGPGPSWVEEVVSGERPLLGVSSDPFERRLLQRILGPGVRFGTVVPGLLELNQELAVQMEVDRTGGHTFVPGKGTLNPEQWAVYKQDESPKLRQQAERELEKLRGAVKEWKKAQDVDDPISGALLGLPVMVATEATDRHWASYTSHLLAGRSLAEADQIVADAEQDVRIALNSFEKARTYGEAEAAVRSLRFATRFGERSFSEYQSAVIDVGGERTITGIKVGAAAATAWVSAPVLATYGAGAVTAKTVVIGSGLGAGFSATRQGVEMWQGTRQEFSLGEVGGGAAAGGGLALFPQLLPLAVGSGVASAADEFAQGHFKTGTFDMASSLAPFAVQGAPRFINWARPRAAAWTFRAMVGTENAGLRAPYSGSSWREIPVAAYGTPGAAPPARATKPPVIPYLSNAAPEAAWQIGLPSRAPSTSWGSADLPRVVASTGQPTFAPGSWKTVGLPGGHPSPGTSPFTVRIDPAAPAPPARISSSGPSLGAKPTAEAPAPLGRAAGLDRAGRVRDLVGAKVGAVLETSSGRLIEGSSSTVVEPRPPGASAHYKHAEIDVLIEGTKNGQLSGESAVLYVTEHPCAGACLTTNFRGNIVNQFERSGMTSLKIHSPEATIVLERSANGIAVVSSYSVR